MLLSLLVAPSITTPPMDVLVIFPDTAVLTCEADGVPTPTITWWRYDTTLTEVTDAMKNVTIDVTTSDSRTVMSTLTFTNTQPVLAAQYQCTASNLLGVASENATLTVNGELRVSYFYFAFLKLDFFSTAVDINECDTNNGGCSHVCTNTRGSFQCSCNDGYKLDDTDGKTCKDINECFTGSQQCEQICTNTLGSFTCDCEGGYELNTDGRTCESMFKHGNKIIYHYYILSV